MQIPAEFRLFGQTWHVRAAQPGELTDSLGECRPDQMEIVLNTNQTDQSMLHVFWHEVIHAIETKLDLQMTERSVDLIALGLIDLYTNNPILARAWIVPTLEETADAVPEKE